MPPVSKKWRGHTGLGMSVCLVCVCVCLSVCLLRFAYGQERLEMGS